MDAIAARVPVSKPTLYNYFESKEALFRALVQALSSHIDRSAHLRYAPREPLRDQLCRHVRAAAAFLADEGNLQLFRAILAEHIRKAQNIDTAVAGYWEADYGIGAWIEAAVADGRLRVDDPRLAADLLTGMIRGLVIWPPALASGGAGSPAVSEAGGERAIDMFLSFYAAEPGQPATADAPSGGASKGNSSSRRAAAVGNKPRLRR
jgi:TetR/AcrR family transcriptional regulator of autoinduction and epiphytic fitness